MDIQKQLINEFSLKAYQAENVIKLIDDGNTIPFIARYRKEMTGSLDDTVLRNFHERLNYLRNLDTQRQKATEAIEALGKMTDEIRSALDNAITLTEIEDIHRPFRQKRKTRASIAKEKGLQPLADIILTQDKNIDPVLVAKEYIDEEKGVNSEDDALCGASDIIAEAISDSAVVRKRLREVVMASGKLSSKAADEEDIGVYANYTEYSEPMNKIPSHRILAVNRGEREGKLKVGIDFEKQYAMRIIDGEFVENNSRCAEFVVNAGEDAYDRLIFPSVSREMRNELSERANADAIKVFSSNLRQLLMQPPMKNKVTIGLDPGYRTGCKVAVVDGTGRVLDTAVIYPAPPHNKIDEAKRKITALINKHNVEVFAIGNGTATHETELFAAELIRELDRGISYMIVSEAGASVYSASEAAAKEFPDYDVSLRSAVSIARRLQDPLAELVKIDPKAVGVGQYQHDMPQNQLSAALDGVVEECVNSVGVDLNTASGALLTRIAGINSAVANNIVAYREANGAFTSRTELKKVPKLGAKAYEQCAGFLRISGGKEPLDATAVHPESYKAAKGLMSLYKYTPEALKNRSINGLQEKLENDDVNCVAEKLGIGVPTLLDIASELQKPGRDPRDELPAPMLRTDVISIESLKPGMELKGTVRNVIDFGAFVDIGVHQDGLVHISQICNRYIKHPSEVLSVGDIVTVWVMAVDVAKNRISLTMKKPKDQN